MTTTGTRLASSRSRPGSPTWLSLPGRGQRRPRGGLGGSTTPGHPGRGGWHAGHAESPPGRGPPPLPLLPSSLRRSAQVVYEPCRTLDETGLEGRVDPPRQSLSLRATALHTRPTRRVESLMVGASLRMRLRREDWGRGMGSSTLVKVSWRPGVSWGRNRSIFGPSNGGVNADIR